MRVNCNLNFEFSHILLDCIPPPQLHQLKISLLSYRNCRPCRPGAHTRRFKIVYSAKQWHIMDARSAMRPYFADVFFFLFFMTALVGQTAERIFTKLSHVVDIRCYLRTY